jgi:acyl-CoA reductase-like NAD-dependent aldehyde dehydrogenase
MTKRLSITKTYKLFIGGAFPRTESGRSIAIADPAGRVLAHTCRASRKDLRNAVEAAAGAAAKWAGASAYLRGQILYRIAEMAEGKRVELIEACRAMDGRSASEAAREVDASIDRLVAFAGWTDKFSQVLGCANPVSGPYHNFTIPEPSGVAGVVCPDEMPLLALVSLAAPPLAAGCPVIVLASEVNPIPAMVLAECCATGDVPGGVVNILTGQREELVPQFASHREIIALHAAGPSAEHGTTLRAGAAENLKRVTVRETAGEAWFDRADCESPWWIEPFVEFKTLWHPSSA